LSDAYGRETESQIQQLEREGNHELADELRYEAWSVSACDDFEAMANWLGSARMFLLSRDMHRAALYPEGWRDHPITAAQFRQWMEEPEPAYTLEALTALSCCGGGQ
jgi:hypothetical protein